MENSILSLTTLPIQGSVVTCKIMQNRRYILVNLKFLKFRKFDITNQQSVTNTDLYI